MEFERLQFGVRRRLRVPLQTEKADCGYACLVGIATFLGHDISLRQLKQRFPPSSRGTSIEQLRKIANSLELSGRAVSYDPDCPRDLVLPSIIHVSGAHFVVLSKVGPRSAIVFDPSSGKKRVSIRDLAAMSSGSALELMPASGFTEQKGDDRIRLRVIWRATKGIIKSSAAIFLLSAFLQILAILSPLFMQSVIDSVIVAADVSLLTVLAAGFTLLLVLQVSIGLIRESLILTISNQMSYQLNSNLFRHLIHLPMRFFSTRHTGDISSRFGSLKTVRQMISVGFVTALLDGMLAVAMIVVMFFYSLRLASIVLLFTLFFVTIRLVTHSAYRERTEALINAQASADTHFLETVRTIEPLKVFGREIQRHSRWQDLFVNSINNSMSLARWGMFFSSSNTLIFGLLTIMVLYNAAILVIQSTFTVGMLMAFMAYSSRFTSSVQSLISQLFNLRLIDVHLERISDIALEEPEARYSAGENGIVDRDKSETVSLEVNKLAYRHSAEDDYLFENLSLNASSNELVVIYGPNGSGKTTLIRCMLGLLVPETGSVRVHSESGESSLLDESGVVMQHDRLMAGTIAENICFFDDQPDTVRIHRAAELVQLHDFVVSMPLEYESSIGELSAGLSGGQYQKILLARALYKTPRILILDEAMVHLDPESEDVIIDRLMGLGCLIILVTHRRDLLGRADRTVTLDDMQEAGR
ncbi:MAG: peptidase domain-containing ABC transporter [Pseudomonadota bacterium]